MFNTVVVVNDRKDTLFGKTAAVASSPNMALIEALQKEKAAGHIQQVVVSLALNGQQPDGLHLLELVNLFKEKEKTIDFIQLFFSPWLTEIHAPNKHAERYLELQKLAVELNKDSPGAFQKLVSAVYSNNELKDLGEQQQAIVDKIIEIKAMEATLLQNLRTGQTLKVRVGNDVKNFNIEYTPHIKVNFHTMVQVAAYYSNLYGNKDFNLVVIACNDEAHKFWSQFNDPNCKDVNVQVFRAEFPNAQVKVTTKMKASDSIRRYNEDSEAARVQLQNSIRRVIGQELLEEDSVFYSSLQVLDASIEENSPTYFQLYKDKQDRLTEMDCFRLEQPYSQQAFDPELNQKVRVNLRRFIEALKFYTDKQDVIAASKVINTLVDKLLEDEKFYLREWLMSGKINDAEVRRISCDPAHPLQKVAAEISEGSARKSDAVNVLLKYLLACEDPLYVETIAGPAIEELLEDEKKEVFESEREVFLENAKKMRETIHIKLSLKLIVYKALIKAAVADWSQRAGDKAFVNNPILDFLSKLVERANSPDMLYHIVGFMARHSSIKKSGEDVLLQLEKDMAKCFVAYQLSDESIEYIQTKLFPSSNRHAFKAPSSREVTSQLTAVELLLLHPQSYDNHPMSTIKFTPPNNPEAGRRVEKEKGSVGSLEEAAAEGDAARAFKKPPAALNALVAAGSFGQSSEQPGIEPEPEPELKQPIQGQGSGQKFKKK